MQDAPEKLTARRNCHGLRSDSQPLNVVQPNDASLELNHGSRNNPLFQLADQKAVPVCFSLKSCHDPTKFSNLRFRDRTIMVSGDKDRKDAWGHYASTSTPVGCMDHARIMAWIVMHFMNAAWGLQQHNRDRSVHSSTAEG